MVAFGEAMGLPTAIAERELRQLLSKSDAAGLALLDELPEGSHAGEKRFTRQIVHGVMKDMAKQLG